MLLIHVPGECERVLEAASPNSRGESDVPKAEQALGSRTSHGVDI
jgi:hypothetical protein